MRAVEKSILITGCSSGIGAASARYLRDRGWRVFASCRQPQDCARLADDGFETTLIDYEAPQTIAQGFDSVLEATGSTLGALFNNGAYAVPGLVEDLPVEALRAIFEANFFGWHDLTRRAIPVMRRAGAGRIVQNSSVLGLVPMTFRGAYVSAKFALEGLTDCLRIEMHGTGIGVSLIEPGPITTRIRQNAIPHFEKWIDAGSSARAADYARLRDRLYGPPSRDPFELLPEAVAKKLLHALEARTPKPRYYVTTPTYFMGACRRLLPTRVLDWLLANG